MLINEYHQHAKSVLPKMVYDYYASGAWDETTLKHNQADYQQYEIVYRILREVGKRNLGAKLINQDFAAPIGICPLGLQQMAHPDGELATAQAAIEMKVPYTLSTMSNYTLEQVGQCFSDKTSSPWFQLYIHKDRQLTLDLVRRAESSGFSALFVTVDAPMLGVRERDIKNKFALPENLTLGTLARNFPNTSTSGLMQDFANNICPNISFKDIDWLASNTKLPIILKGVVHPEDVKLAKEHGSSAVLVSNHGGRQLDGCISSIHALSMIQSSKYADLLPLYIDGGIRRGKDILVALALGAQAVFVGRPILWGLAYNGKQGVIDVLETLIKELDIALALSGCSNIVQARNLDIMKRV